MKILSIIFLFATFSACSQDKQTKKHEPDPKAKQLNDSAINIAMQSPPKNFEKAISLLDQATQIDSNYFAAYESKLSFQFSLDRFNDALATAKNLIRISPESPTSYFITGILLDKTGDSINSQKHYNESIKRINSILENMDKSNRKYEDYLMNKGINLILLGQQQKGHDILKEICDKQKDPTLKEIYCQFISKSRKEILEDFFSANPTSVSEPKIVN